MTPANLLSQFPYDPSKRGLERNYVLPRKLITLEDDRLRRSVAEAFLWSPAGKEWVRLYRIRSGEDAIHYSDDSDRRHP